MGLEKNKQRKPSQTDRIPPTEELNKNSNNLPTSPKSIQIPEFYQKTPPKTIDHDHVINHIPSKNENPKIKKDKSYSLENSEQIINIEDDEILINYIKQREIEKLFWM
ncbi:hypothetical protein BB559_002474 [Furculomyces boomerangus]|uniref:Uncharacterized protein n=2 Tax=Harpellales TaxID=61421 RepID=A0A2T9YV39_9FUNG|nr:hypothetical protein BB559_002474 [Furculomyces boomerangus]PWA00228.1 hypothetical protein BB558_003722 [Smittium angustum]